MQITHTKYYVNFYFLVVYITLCRILNALGRSPRRVVGNLLDCKFETQSLYYVHFWIHSQEKGMNLLIFKSNGLNNTTILLKIWL